MDESWPIHTVVFDVDDTLYPERNYVLSGFTAVDTRLSATMQIEGFGDRAKRLFKTGRRGKIFDEALLELGIKPQPALIAALVNAYRKHVPVLSLAEDALAVLPWLASHFNLAALTDGDAAVQRSKIAALGLSRTIKFCVVTDEIGREFWKPHSAGFERIMNRFGGVPSGFVYVADNPRKDFIAPKRLGWRTIRVTRHGGEHASYVATPEEEAEITIEDLRKLQRILVPLKDHL